MNQVNLNTFRADKCTLQITNIPTVKDINDMFLFEGMLSGISIPAFGLTMDQSDMQGYRLPQQVGHEINRNLGDLGITFKLSYGMKNYIYLWQWIKNVRDGENIDTKSGFLKDYLIEEIRVGILDNVKRTIGTFIFDKCKISGLSGIELRFGTAEEIPFTATFAYDGIYFDENLTATCTT
jgi:hypothetical protein